MAATISDAVTGELLFYTDGWNAWNRNHQLMPNGQELSPNTDNFIYHQSLIVPAGDRDNFFYIFTINHDSSRGFTYSLFASLVNMNLHGGLGDIVAKQELLLQDLSSRLTAVPHTNGNDFWLITHSRTSDIFFVASVSREGISEFQPQSIGPDFPATRPTILNHGTMKPSPDGKMLACTINPDTYTTEDNLQLYDFDASNGLLSNYRPLAHPGAPFGLSFSPDNSKLYVSFISINEDPRFSEEAYNAIYQYEVNNPAVAAINASAIGLIANNTCFNYQAGNGGGPSFTLQLAPDGRIYSGTNWLALQGEDSQRQLLVIHHPNRKEFDVQIEKKTFALGQEAYLGPYTPLFLESYFNNLEPLPREFEPVSVIAYPNPTTTAVRISQENNCRDNEVYDLRIINSTGQLVGRVQKGVTGATEVNLSMYPAGLYLLVLDFGGRQQVVKKVVKVN
ncbi:T9SS type A sorting domain-containing protein [Pontibacter sp. 13R65]|uniref:T9SS type A sorting domain-containing protein n=1 Tax=Pontibacter sp. 13R65 TaxID=3127458 RepID=UPI00301C56F6